MANERNEILMSQLSDGELPSDEVNELLLDVLGAPAQREKLKELLRLRQATAGWRTKEPPRPVTVAAEPSRAFRPDRPAWRMSRLAVAACVGGLLVLVGVWTAGWLGRQDQVAKGPDAPLPARVTPEQMRQVGKVFALHESVAGPLAWYADDDRNIRLASARGTEVDLAPIGVLLKLKSAVSGAAERTLVIVCREDQPAVIELPAETEGQTGLRVYLAPRVVNGTVQMQYAIAVDGQSQQTPPASLAGQRRLGLVETSLGQLAMGDHVLNVQATAWPLQGRHK